MGPGGPGCGLPLRLRRWAQGRSSQAPCAVSGRLNRPSLCRPKSPGPARAAGGARPPARQHGRRGQRGRGHNGLEETGGLAGATPGSQPLSTLGSGASRAALLATERSRSKIIIQDLTLSSPGQRPRPDPTPGPAGHYGSGGTHAPWTAGLVWGRASGTPEPCVVEEGNASPTPLNAVLSR